MKLMKKRFFMKPNINHNKCDCGGEMKVTGVVYDSYPPQREFKCDTCGKKIIKVDFDITDNENNIVEDIIEETLNGDK